jgi:hypothetical protein
MKKVTLLLGVVVELLVLNELENQLLMLLKWLLKMRLKKPELFTVWSQQKPILKV